MRILMNQEEIITNKSIKAITKKLTAGEISKGAAVRELFAGGLSVKEISDITTFHCYEKPGRAENPFLPWPVERTFEQEIEGAKAPGRPILCTECLARTFGNELDTFLPIYSKEHIGFYVWALVAGSAQYHIPWGWPIGSPVPKRWFHCMFYPDGAAFDDSEIEQIQKFDFE